MNKPNLTDQQILEKALEEQAWYLEAWQYNLQQMVVSDNWIKYLGENI